MKTETETYCTDCGVVIDSKYERCYSCNEKNNGNTSFKHVESEGEEFIADFFYFTDIKFNKQVEIHNLKGDSKKFRVADFELTDYNILVEYDGYWHIDKDRYKEKKRVYKLNNRPCIYLYPENLGALEFFFDKRIQKVLKLHNMNKELRKYRWFKFRKGESKRIGYTIALLAAIIVVPIFDMTTGPALYVFVGLGVAYQFWQTIEAYRDVFVHDKYPIPMD